MAPSLAQPGMFIIGSATSPFHGAKPYPLKTSQTPLYAVGVVPARRKPQPWRISALAGRQGRLRACTQKLTAAPPKAMKKVSYNTHH
jgi:hypothetical protein